MVQGIDRRLEGLYGSRDLEADIPAFVAHVEELVERRAISRYYARFALAEAYKPVYSSGLEGGEQSRIVQIVQNAMSAYPTSVTGFDDIL